MYLPALPSMNSYFGSSSAITNLTLSAFFLFYAVGILFWGPLSDKYGRKPILLVGSILYAVSSIACAMSVNIYFLIAARILQGISSGAITSVSMAVVKDSYTGKKRESILAICQSIAGLAPMVAPIVGALILTFSDWRGSFWALALISIVNLGFSILFQETLKDEERYKGTLYRIGKHRNVPGFHFMGKHCLRSRLAHHHLLSNIPAILECVYEIKNSLPGRKEHFIKLNHF